MNRILLILSLGNIIANTRVRLCQVFTFTILPSPFICLRCVLLFPFQLAKKYLKYYFTHPTAKATVFILLLYLTLLQNVLRDKNEYPCYYQTIEQHRRRIVNMIRNTIEVEDFGAGSSVIKSNKRVVKDIAASSLKPKKFARLLFRMVQYYKPDTIIELGTSLGITTCLHGFRQMNKQSVFTVEGSSAIAGIAKRSFEKLRVNNVNLQQAKF